MKKLLNILNSYDKWSISFEERHPYITGSICMTALLASLYGLLIIGKIAGY